jgi:hypothetical protein
MTMTAKEVAEQQAKRRAENEAQFLAVSPLHKAAVEELKELGWDLSESQKIEGYDSFTMYAHEDTDRTIYLVNVGKKDEPKVEFFASDDRKSYSRWDSHRSIKPLDILRKAKSYVSATKAAERKAAKEQAEREEREKKRKAALARREVVEARILADLLEFGFSSIKKVHINPSSYTLSDKDNYITRVRIEGASFKGMIEDKQIELDRSSKRDPKTGKMERWWTPDGYGGYRPSYRLDEESVKTLCEWRLFLVKVVKIVEKYDSEL